MALPDTLHRPLFPHRLSGIIAPPDGKVALAFAADGHFIADQIDQSDQPPAALFVYTEPDRIEMWKSQSPENIRALIDAPDERLSHLR